MNSFSFALSIMIFVLCMNLFIYTFIWKKETKPWLFPSMWLLRLLLHLLHISQFIYFFCYIVIFRSLVDLNVVSGYNLMIRAHWIYMNTWVALQTCMPRNSKFFVCIEFQYKIELLWLGEIFVGWDFPFEPDALPACKSTHTRAHIHIIQYYAIIIIILLLSILLLSLFIIIIVGCFFS